MKCRDARAKTSSVVAVNIALYARVSTDKEGGQDPETQLYALRNWAARMGYTAVQEYVDKASANDLRGRVRWRQLLDDGRQHKFDLVAVVKLDRAWRSVAQMYVDLEHFASRNVQFVSITQDIDTRGAMGRLLLNILGAVAEFERELIRERTREGLARAKAQGKRLGRPPGAKDGKKRLRGGYVKRYEKVGAPRDDAGRWAES